MKAIWAVACSLLGAGAIVMMCSGCSAKKSSLSNSVEETTGRSAPATGLKSIDELNAQLAKAANAHGRQSSSSVNDYRIGAEDVLRVSVWDNRDLTLEVTVRPDGKISVPLIRDVQAEGLTASELADVIQKRFLSYVKDPQVSIIVLQVNAPKIFVIGNVARPGPYPLRSEMSALQVLSLAGGFTQYASQRSIRIVRGSGGKQEVKKINYFEMIEENGTGNYLMESGDTLVVP